MNYIDQAKRAFESKKYKEAYKLFSQALDSGDERALILCSMAECLYFLGKHDDAISRANEALSLDSKSARTHLVLSYSYAGKLEYEKSVIEAQNALLLDPNMLDALSFLSSLYIAQRKTSDALEAVHKVLDIDSGSWIGHYNLGRIFQHDKSYQMAATEFLLAYKIKPSFRPLLGLLETRRSQYFVWYGLGILSFLIISVRFYHLLWMPMLYSLLGILEGLLQFIVYRDRSYLRNSFIYFIAILLFYLYT
jgi:tetratricopeptide (TPR) repeat protein